MRSYRASSLGSCTKAQIALQLGYTPLETPDKVEAIYARGRDHEVECVAAMEADSWTFMHAGFDKAITGAGDQLAVDEGQWYVELEVTGAVITGHLDGMAYQHAGDRVIRVIEIKSPQSFHKWERAHKTGDYSDPLMNRYAWQISVYMAATGLEAVVACVEDGQVRTFGIEVAPHSLVEIEDLVTTMEACVEDGIMPMCSQADYPCPVAYLHEKAEVEYDDDAQLLNAVTDYLTAADQEKAAKIRKDEARQLIDGMVKGDKVHTRVGSVTRYTTTRKSYDYDAMERDGIDLAKYVTEKESESVRITKKEGGQS